MKVGAKVEITHGKLSGRRGVIYFVYPGKGDGEVWPYYFRVRLEPGVMMGVMMEATKNCLRLVETK